MPTVKSGRPALDGWTATSGFVLVTVELVALVCLLSLGFWALFTWLDQVFGP